jgi:hypothetical protein
MVTREILTGDQLGALVVAAFGDRLEAPEILADERRVTGRLYGRFRFEIRIDDPHGQLSSGVWIDDYAMIHPFRQVPPMDGDRDSVLVALALFDEYCRLRLPDAELAAYDREHGTGPIGQRTAS